MACLFSPVMQAHTHTEPHVLQDLRHGEHLCVKSQVFPDTETIEVLSSADGADKGAILALKQKQVCCLCRENFKGIAHPK